MVFLCLKPLNIRDIIQETKSYEFPTLFPFFMNMLQEETIRRVICRTSRVDESDFFGLLAAMAGKDFIGGVHIERVSK